MAKGGISGLFKKIKKAVSIKNVVKVAAAVIPGAAAVQAAIQSGAAAKEQAVQAQQAAVDQLNQAGASGTTSAVPGAAPSRDSLPMKWVLIGGGALVALMLLMRRR